MRLAYEAKFRSVLYEKVCQIQRVYRAKQIKLQAKLHGIFRATIYFDANELVDIKGCSVDKVEIFGDFTENSQDCGAWDKKIPCKKFIASSGLRIGSKHGDKSSNIFSVLVEIKFG